MRFSLSHDLDAPPDLVELAVLSPELPARILHELGAARMEAIDVLEQSLEGGSFRRTLRYQAAAPLPALQRLLGGRVIRRDMMCWDEQFSYERATRTARWTVSPMPEYARWFGAHGTFRLEALADGRSRRTVDGDIEVRVRLLGPVIERIALAEVHKTYDAEAAALRTLATL